MIKLLDVSAVLPKYQTKGSVGLDLHSIEDAIISAGSRAVIRTGLALELPQGFEAQVRSRSGLAAKNGVFVLNSPGTIDSDYTGEIQVILQNLGEVDFTINKGDRIAQLVLAQVVIIDALVKDNTRAEGGLGSTGI